MVIDGLIQTATTLGVGACFGLIMFWVYRIDSKRNADRLAELLRQDQETREENTRMVSHLITLIETMCKNG